MRADGVDSGNPVRARAGGVDVTGVGARVAVGAELDVGAKRSAAAQTPEMPLFAADGREPALIEVLPSPTIPAEPDRAPMAANANAEALGTVDHGGRGRGPGRGAGPCSYARRTPGPEVASIRLRKMY